MRKKKLYVLVLMLVVMVFVPGCGEQKGRITDGSEVYVKRESKEDKNKKEEDDEKKEEEKEESQKPEKLYVITGIDTEHKILTLRDCENTKEKPYNYTGGTYIRDKYGDNLTIDQIFEGELVTIERRGKNLTEVQVSKDAFSYQDLQNFDLDKKKKSFTVGGIRYSFDEDLLVYHGKSKISLSELSDQDMVSIKGIGQQIYTIQVTNGHGTVVLENTELFQGGNITIGNILSKKITPEMRIEVAEGSYLLSVANDGYGGSKEIKVEANRETKINLDELKGEGPQFCQIQFKLTPETAVLYLDGELISAAQPVQVRYGVHRLTATAEGYQEWKKTLVVNSATAEIKVEMSSQEQKEEEEVSTSGSSQQSSSQTNGNTNGNQNQVNNNRTNTNSNSNNNRTNTNNNNTNNNNNGNSNNNGNNNNNGNSSNNGNINNNRNDNTNGNNNNGNSSNNGNDNNNGNSSNNNGNNNNGNSSNNGNTNNGNDNTNGTTNNGDDDNNGTGSGRIDGND